MNELPNVERIALSVELIDRYNVTRWWKLRTRARLRRQVLRLLIDIYRPLETS
jgi:hypothetical protein